MKIKKIVSQIFNPINDILKYVEIYKKFLGLKIYLGFSLFIISNILEGIGILMFIPLLESLSKNQFHSDNQHSFILENIVKIFQLINVDLNSFNLVIFIIFSILIKSLFLYLAFSYIAFLRSDLTVILKKKIYKTFSNISYGYYQKLSISHTNNLLNEQSNRAVLAYYYLNQLISAVCVTLVYLAVSVSVDISVVLLCVPIVLLLIFLSKTLVSDVRLASRFFSSQSSILTKQSIQFLQNFKYLKATNNINFSDKEIYNSIYKLSSYEKKIGRSQAGTLSLKEPIVLIIILIAIYYKVVMLGQSLEQTLVSFLCVYRSLTGILSIQGYSQQTFQFVGSIEAIDSELSIQRKNFEKSGKRKITNLREAILMKDLTFSFENRSKEIFKNVNLKINAFETIGIIGKSGVGKSTFIDILTTLITPSSGDLIIDSIKSNEIDKASWRSRIAFVKQDVDIFEGTIESNINIESKKVNYQFQQKKLKEVSKIVGIYEFINSLPKGFQTKVGERGLNLSGGQRQRIGIARELFREPSLLILDEVTSSLDVNSENQIIKCIKSIKGKLTIIIISHKYNILDDCDRIFEIKNSRFRELRKI
ncbi:ABC transporter ATP-binding protein/permease [Prochlorococcus sp. AH-716-M06]|nr:ABC transporter ATP-binding protein/permease [Prochlorococcus sp. AH-716-M06]